MRSRTVSLVDGLELANDRGALFVLGGWPERCRLSAGFVLAFLRPGSDDLVDIQASNGRGIYRVRPAEDPREFAYDAERVYEETDG